MARSTVSGPWVSQNGFIGNLTGAVAATTIAASGNATLSGTANVIIIPTVDPEVAGAFWSDEGTLSISAGA